MTSTEHSTGTAGTTSAPSRRALLKGAAALAVLSTSPAAAAEHPWDRARRLASELSETLTELDGGRWYTEIWPKGILARPPVYFGDVELTLEDDFHDRPLIILGSEFEKAWAHEERSRLTARETGDWTEWDAAFEVTGDIVDSIEPMPAKTLAGLKVKARCAQWCWGDEPVVRLNEHETTDVKLALSIVESLLGGAQ